MSFLSDLIHQILSPKMVPKLPADPRRVLPVTIWDTTATHHVVSGVMLHPPIRAVGIDALNEGNHFEAVPTGSDQYTVRLLSPSRGTLHFRTCDRNHAALAWAVEKILLDLDKEKRIG